MFALSMFGLEESLLERLTRRPLYLPDRQRFLSHGAFDPFLVTKLVRNYRYRGQTKCNLRYSLQRVVGYRRARLDLYDSGTIG
jgi:hypothetical protein